MAAPARGRQDQREQRVDRLSDDPGARVHQEGEPLSDRAYRRGRAGEAEAARHLETRGWTVLDRNWRDGPRELDLVVTRDGVLAFVEVKTRGEGGWGHPLESITRRKRREVEQAARAWLGAHAGATGVRGIRFDAVVVRLPASGRATVEHVPDAWRPGWDG